MIKLNDHYLLAWLKVFKKIPINFYKGGFFVDLTPQQYEKVLKEYESTYKPIMKEVRRVIKELNNIKANADLEKLSV